jgi:hypothetical protein
MEQSRAENRGHSSRAFEAFASCFSAGFHSSGKWNEDDFYIPPAGGFQFIGEGAGFSLFHA